jgi:hypothetical protein
MTSSPAILAALDQWRTARKEYDLVLEAAYDAAEDATRGYLLNERGRRAGVSARSLFMGPEVRARAYASEELLTWWEQHPRVTFAQFERAWHDGPYGHGWGGDVSW